MQKSLSWRAPWPYAPFAQGSGTATGFVYLSTYYADNLKAISEISLPSD
ncbi:hypothetical protein Cenrod_1507 [Candidatus Symbiobacter mobilis CR]|uniref:Uncharacterized protein n=1 Tax=Candidatus Symbiobacter mobilis CR TaxID=946483 RepID=U5NBH5_9BURK|nr:hypothetical protein Cenrod_1507 [Candidatus Symbiobacter mobilis CR]